MLPSDDNDTGNTNLEIQKAEFNKDSLNLALGRIPEDERKEALSWRSRIDSKSSEQSRG